MIRLGLTQRVEVVEAYGERRDCLDQAWTTLLESWGYQPIALPNRIEDVDTYLDSLELDGIILTGGNDVGSIDDPDNPAPERDSFETKALDYAISEQLPVLGVCRGIEFVNVAFGGSLSPVAGHVAEDHTVMFESESCEIERLTFPETTTVNSYHNIGIQQKNVANEFTVVGRADDGTIECVVHESHPIIGIMWHPERDSPSIDLDQQILNTLFRTDQ